MRTFQMRMMVAAIVFLVHFDGLARAQLSPAIAAPIVKNYVTSLQYGNIQALRQLTGPYQFQYVMQQSTGSGVFPVLAHLGPITDVKVGNTVSALIFTATVRHLHGESDWQFQLDTSKPIILAANLLRVAFQQPTILPPPSPESNRNSACSAFPAMCSDDSPRTKGQTQATIFPNSPIASPTPPSVQSQAIDWPCNAMPAACGTRQRTFTDDPRLVEFLFATDRIPQNGAQAVLFTGDRQSALTFGAVSVHVPQTHKIGKIELPSVWKVWGIELRHEPLDENKHFVIRQLQIMPLNVWGDLIRQTQAKSALIFVHGFNTSFEDAVLRNAQIIYDLDYKGLSILYSWSSRGGSVLDYRYDLDSAYAGREGFIALLKMLHDDFGIERVDVLAHSMGNLLVLDALKNSVSTANPAHLNQLIMAAPDVPRDTFERQLPDIQKIAAGTTLYASGADKALTASKLLAIYDRAGDVPTTGLPVILPGLDTIDVTAIGDELLGLNHSEFATNRSVMDDLKILLDTQQRASRLSQIRSYPDQATGPHYWRYVP